MDADGKNIKQLTFFDKIATPAAYSPFNILISSRVTDVAY